VKEQATEQPVDWMPEFLTQTGKEWAVQSERSEYQVQPIPLQVDRAVAFHSGPSSRASSELLSGYFLARIQRRHRQLHHCQNSEAQEMLD